MQRNYGPAPIINSGSFQRQAPAYSDDKRYIIAILDSEKAGIVKAHNRNPAPIRRYLYPTQATIGALGFCSLSELVANRKNIINTIPEGYGALAILDTKRMATLCDLFIAYRKPLTVEEMHQKWVKTADMHLTNLEIIHGSINPDHTIMRARTKPNNYKYMAFFPNDCAVILDPQTGDVLHAGAKALCAVSPFAMKEIFQPAQDPDSDAARRSLIMLRAAIFRSSKLQKS